MGEKSADQKRGQSGGEGFNKSGADVQKKLGEQAVKGASKK